MKKNISIAKCLTVGILLLILGSPAIAAETQKTLYIGLTAAFSGTAARWGLAWKGAAELVAEKYNAKGGVNVAGQKYKVEIESYDDKYTAAGAITGLKKMISERNIHYVFIQSSVGSLAVIPLVKENNVVTFTCAMSNKPYIDSEWIFGSFISLPAIAEAWWPWMAKNRPNIKTVATIAPNDEGGIASAKAAEDFSQAQGVKIVAKELYLRGTTDFFSQIAKLMAAKPDMIFMCCMPGTDIATICKQARESGFKGTLGTDLNTHPKEALKIAGAQNLEGLIEFSPGYYDPGQLSTKSLVQLKKDYIARHGGEQFETGLACYYTGPWVLLQAFEKAGTIDPVKVREFLPSTSYDSLWEKPIRFGGASYSGGRNSRIIFPVFIFEWKNGEMVPIAFM